MVKAIPEDYHSVTPYLAINGAANAIEFYKKAFGATERMRFDAPGGKIGHAEISIGDSIIMMADEFPEMNFRAPQAGAGTSVSLMLYVEDVDSFIEKAVAAGAKLERPIKDEFYGDRTGTIKDPYGHMWHIATHKEDLTMEEIGKRAAAAGK